MSNVSRDYVEFIDAVLLFRTCRDTIHSCSPGHEPELWMDQRLEGLVRARLEDPDYYDDETVQWLSLGTKMAELIDPGKAWLLEEIDEDLRQIYFPGSQKAEVTISSFGMDSDWWLDRELHDDFGSHLLRSLDPEQGTVQLAGNIKADDKETADRILRERVEKFLAALPQAA